MTSVRMLTAPSSTIADSGLPMTVMNRSADTTNPLRRFLRTESGSAGLLMIAVLAAVVWTSISTAAYKGFWEQQVPIRIGGWSAAPSIREIINEGLMTLFFLVVGLEARREFDLGELRDRRRLLHPLVVGTVGLLIPVLIFVVVNAGSSTVVGWGAAMSTDTALALGLLAVIGRGMPDQIRSFLLTVLVVDDIAALLVIAIFYSDDITPAPLLVGLLALAVLVASRSLRRGQRRLVFAGATAAMWWSLQAAGIDPVVAGLTAGLATSAQLPRRRSLEAATALVRRFREEPTPELARTARDGLAESISFNTQAQFRLHPFVSRIVVPLFALANAGVAVSPAAIQDGLHSRITIGIVLAFLVGKPLAAIGTTVVLARISRGRVRSQLGYGALIGSGMSGAIGLTVSLLIAHLVFIGADLDRAKLGILATVLLSGLASAVTFGVIRILPGTMRAKALYADTEELVDLVDEVDPEIDHVYGPVDAAVTVVEYGDFECPWTAMISPTAAELVEGNADVRYVWRQLPLTDVHPHAQLAAEASEAAAAQGRYWEMHHRLLSGQDGLSDEQVLGYADELGLDPTIFAADLRTGRHSLRVGRDIESADLSGVAGTPTFFVDGRRQDGPQDLGTLTAAISAARAKRSAKVAA